MKSRSRIGALREIGVMRVMRGMDALRELGADRRHPARFFKENQS